MIIDKIYAVELSLILNARLQFYYVLSSNYILNIPTFPTILTYKLQCTKLPRGINTIIIAVLCYK